MPNRVAGGFSPPAPTTPPINRDLRHAALGCKGPGKMPGTLSANGYGYGIMQGGTELTQLSHLCPGISPLFPIAHANPSPEPVIDFRDRTIIFRYPEIVHPATEILGQLNGCQAYTVDREPQKLISKIVSDLDL